MLADEKILGTWFDDCTVGNFFGLSKDFTYTLEFNASQLVWTTSYYDSADATCSSAILDEVHTYEYWISGQEDTTPDIDSDLVSQSYYNMTIESFQYVIDPKEQVLTGTSGHVDKFLNDQGYCNYRQWVGGTSADLTEQDPCNSSSDNLPRYTLIRIDTSNTEQNLAIGTLSTIITSRPSEAGTATYIKQ